MIDRRWLFILSCIALVTSAFTFSVRGDVLQELGDAFQLNQAQKGSIEGGVFVGMALSMLVGGFVCDFLGMKLVLILACASHLLGTLGTIYAPHNAGSFNWLWTASILMGCGNGLTEVAINPLIATIYSDRKTHFLNILHAWWPGGLVIGGLSAQLGVRGLFPVSAANPRAEKVLLGFDGWQVSLWLIAIPAIVYGIMLITAKFPKTERVASGVSTGEMFAECFRPLFLVLAVCMLMTASTELGPQKWQESVMQSTAGVSGTLILVYTSGMMFVLRHFAGPIAHKISPVGMMLGSSILAGIGLFLLSTATNAVTAFGFATIFGLGIAYFWPTMLGITAERFPKGGALAMALMGSVGNLAISQVLPQMGQIVDRYSVAEVQKVDDAQIQSELLVLDATSGKPVSINAKVAADAKAKKMENAKLEPADQKALTPIEQAAFDAQKVGFSMAFRWVSVLPAILVVLFSGIILYDRSRGGYRAEVLTSRHE